MKRLNESSEIGLPLQTWEQTTPANTVPRKRTLKPVRSFHRTLVLTSCILIALFITNGCGKNKEAADQSAATLSETTTSSSTNPPTEPTVTLEPSESPESPTPTLTISQTIELNYDQGTLAYQQQDWEGAAAFLHEVYDRDDNYVGSAGSIENILSATHYNWGAHLEQTAETELITDTMGVTETLVMTSGHKLVQALYQYTTTLTISPEHQLAMEGQARLGPYVEARMAMVEEDFPQSIAKFEALREIQSEYRDTVDLLYISYVEYAGSLEDDGARMEAWKHYAKAIELPLPPERIAEAQEGYRRTHPPTPTPRTWPTATPAPPPTATPIPPPPSDPTIPCLTPYTMGGCN